jgi:hypothetical protein
MKSCRKRSRTEGVKVWRLSSVLLGSGLLVGSLGCAEPHSTEPYPTWISTLPKSNEDICAVGISGPTYYAEDARANSKAAAMTELARALEVTVTSQLTVQTNGDTIGSDTLIRERSGFSSEVMLKDAQLREQWVHLGGDRKPGEPGTVYTLVCTSLRK